MASEEVKAFLTSIDSRYLDYADRIHNEGFTSIVEVAFANAREAELQAKGVTMGAARQIIDAPQHRGNSFVALTVSHQHCSDMQCATHHLPSKLP